VFVANGQLLAEQVRSFLQASGVGCILRGEFRIADDAGDGPT
jgi:hypothetical protein